MTVSKTILAQLGGNRFLAMTGARNLTGSNDALSMQLPGNARSSDGKRVNGVRIVLDSSDTYTVETVWTRMRPEYKRTVIDTASDVYAENLQDVFTRLTGLATHL